MPVTVSAGHLAPGGGTTRYEPSRSYNYALLIPMLPGDPVGELIRLSVESVSGFNTNNAVIDMRYQNESRKVAGSAHVGNISIVVRDFVDTQTAAVLAAWRRLVHDPDTGEIGFASEYKRQGSLLMLDPKGGDTRSISLVGIWPSSFNTPEFSYTSTTGTVKITMNIIVDTYSLNL